MSWGQGWNCISAQVYQSFSHRVRFAEYAEREIEASQNTRHPQVVHAHTHTHPQPWRSPLILTEDVLCEVPISFGVQRGPTFHHVHEVGEHNFQVATPPPPAKNKKK